MRAIVTGDHFTWQAGAYEICTDRGRLAVDLVHKFLASAYWSLGIPRDVLERAIEHSLPFGLYGPSGRRSGSPGS